VEVVELLLLGINQEHQADQVEVEPMVQVQVVQEILRQLVLRKEIQEQDLQHHQEQEQVVVPEQVQQDHQVLTDLFQQLQVEQVEQVQM
jgi:hypothetical protein